LLKSNKENLLLKGIIRMPVYNGTNGNDNIIGSIFTDSIFGLGGDDTLNPGSGVNDYIDGGAGIDLLVADYSNVSGPYSFSFDNIEKVSFKGSNGDDNFTFNNTTDTLYGNGGNDTLNAGAFDDYLDGGSGSDNLFGGNGNDRLYGQDQNDTLDGSYGNDYLEGGDGNDVLLGSFDNDTLVGGVGEDKLYGEPGKDTLTGGAGADRFGFYSPPSGYEGIDVIKDFNYIEGDKIEITKSSFGASSIYQFSYNDNTGALYFNTTQFATIENKFTGFSTQLDIVLV
jgi:serralysin